MVFRNSKTRRHSEIKQTRPSTKQDFSGEALPDFKPWRSRYESVNYGLATIDSRRQKELTEIHKIPKFGVNQGSFHWYSDLKTSKFTKKCMASGRRVEQLPDCHTFLCKFWRFQMTVSQWKLAWLTPNLGILWISVSFFWLCESIVANPIIYRLVPRPSRFEIRQCFPSKVLLRGWSSLFYFAMPTSFWVPEYH